MAPRLRPAEGTAAGDRQCEAPITMSLEYQPFAQSPEIRKVAKTIARDERVNVSNPERIASMLGGAALFAYGVSHRTLPGVLLGLVGGALVYRGATGHCSLYAKLQSERAEKGVPDNEGIKIEEEIVINRPAAELYAFWRNLENLPSIMSHLKSVRILDSKRSHWVAKAPAGLEVEWEAEIINEHENQMLAWQSLENAEVQNAGSVWFTPSGTGTKVKVSLEYLPPGGKLGAAAAEWLGEGPHTQISEDLQNLKQKLEQGSAAVA